MSDVDSSYAYLSGYMQSCIKGIQKHVERSLAKWDDIDDPDDETGVTNRFHMGDGEAFAHDYYRDRLQSVLDKAELGCKAIDRCKAERDGKRNAKV